MHFGTCLRFLSCARSAAISSAPAQANFGAQPSAAGASAAHKIRSRASSRVWGSVRGVIAELPRWGSVAAPPFRENAGSERFRSARERFSRAALAPAALGCATKIAWGRGTRPRRASRRVVETLLRPRGRGLAPRPCAAKKQPVISARRAPCRGSRGFRR